MKLKFLLIFIAVITLVDTVKSQTYGIWDGSLSATYWSYNFGTDLTTQNAGASAQTFIAPTFFLPASSGNVRGYLAANTGGSFQINNNDITIVAPTGNAPNKFAAYGTLVPSAVTSLFFTINVASAASDGLIILGIGNSTGAIYTNTSQLSGGEQTDLFSAIQFSIASGTITGRFRNKVPVAGTRGYSSFTSSTSLVRDTDLPVELYCNNSSVSQDYNRAGTNYTLPSGHFNIYVNGTPLISGGSANIPASAELAAGKALDSFVFTTSNSTSNALSFTLGDIKMGKSDFDKYAQWAGSAQPTFYSYNVGAASLTENASSYEEAKEFIAPTFLASPPSGNARAFLFSAPTTPGGGFAIGNDKLTMVANHTGGAHKFANYGINNPHQITSLFFTINVNTTPQDGLIILGIGNSSGAIYQNDSQLNSSNQAGLFTALQFAVASDNITAKFRGTTFSYSNLSPTIAKGQDLAVEVFCNNSATSQTYKRLGVDYTIPSGYFHLYVGGVALKTGGSANIPYSAEVAKGQAIDAFVFTAAASTLPTNNSLSFTLSDIKLGRNETVLPVALTDFTAKRQGTNVRLDWATASEQNNQFFELFRSANGKDGFVSLNKMQGNGTTQLAQTYSYTDFNPQAGTNYYKLTQVDNDGKLSGSWLTSATVALGNESLKAYVNGQKQLQLSYNAKNKAAAVIQVNDITGKKVASKNVVLERDQNDISVDLSSLSNGVYIVSLAEAGSQSNAKIIVK